MNNAFEKEESELEKERLHQFLLQFEPKYHRNFYDYNNNRNYGPPVDNNNRPRPRWVTTVNGYLTPYIS
jgi:hypothetical protein